MRERDYPQLIHSDRVLTRSRKFTYLYSFWGICLCLSIIGLLLESYLFFTYQRSSSMISLQITFIITVLIATIFYQLHSNNFKQLKFHHKSFTLKTRKKDIHIEYNRIKKVRLGKFYFSIITDNYRVKLSPYNMERSEYVLRELQKVLPNKFWKPSKYKQYMDHLILQDHGVKYGNFLNFASVISHPQLSFFTIILLLSPIIIFKYQELKYELIGVDWLANSLIMYLGLFIAVSFIIPWVLLFIYKMLQTDEKGKLNSIFDFTTAKKLAYVRFTLDILIIITFLVSTFHHDNNLITTEEIEYKIASLEKKTKAVIDYRYNCFKCRYPLKLNDMVYIQAINSTYIGIVKSTKPENNSFQIYSLQDLQETSINTDKVIGRITILDPRKREQLFQFLPK